MINSINSSEKIPDDFTPKNSGALNRWLYEENVERGKADAKIQAVGRKDVLPPSNPNDYVYSRTIEFPQPSIAGIGVVTAGGSKDSSRYFFSQYWTTQKTATGTYLITHNIGDSKYNVQVSPVATAAFTANISAYNNNSFQVKTFNATGVATDCSFTFVLFMIP